MKARIVNGTEINVPVPFVLPGDINRDSFSKGYKDERVPRCPYCTSCCSRVLWCVSSGGHLSKANEAYACGTAGGKRNNLKGRWGAG